MSEQRTDKKKKRLILTLTLLISGWGLLLLIGRRISPDVQAFLTAASPWVMMGLGVAGALTADGLKEKA